MKKWLAVSVLVVLASVLAAAQERDSVFAGYQYTNVGVAGTRTSVPTGWDADLAVGVGRHVAAVGDVSGAYKDGARIHTFMVGPRVAAGKKLAPFVEALFGAARGFGETKFSMALGGGLDVKAGKNVAIRVAKLDYNLIKIEGTNMNNMRLAAGLVFKF